uniref:Uncharacterized protein n=1 Tax=Palpitomonas bilix TaxID=652834 RepID=A0A7S3DKZ8_9EUKA|mmetsp:Transcript_4250/g.8444  ORF Transcript_4250/g.8444 Transcript_4250/m.8444 type:complete len:292 (+) Transcript_4250:328-1203(+)
MSALMSSSLERRRRAGSVDTAEAAGVNRGGGGESTSEAKTSKEVAEMKAQIKEMRRYVKALVKAEKEREKMGANKGRHHSLSSTGSGGGGGGVGRFARSLGLSAASKQVVRMLQLEGISTAPVKKVCRYPTVLAEKRRLRSLLPAGILGGGRGRGKPPSLPPLRIPFEIAAVPLQAAARGFLVRHRLRVVKVVRRGIVLLQALVRGMRERRRCPFRKKIKQILEGSVTSRVARLEGTVTRLVSVVAAQQKEIQAEKEKNEKLMTAISFLWDQVASMQSIHSGVDVDNSHLE